MKDPQLSPVEYIATRNDRVIVLHLAVQVGVMQDVEDTSMFVASFLLPLGAHEFEGQRDSRARLEGVALEGDFENIARCFSAHSGG